MTRLKGHPHFLNHRDRFGIHTDVIAVAERAVVREDLDHIIFAAGDRLAETDIIRAFLEIVGESGKGERGGSGKGSREKSTALHDE